MPELSGLLVDYGGVLTNALSETMTAFCDAEDVDPTVFMAVMREWFDDAATITTPAQALERGEVEIPHFEEQLAARLSTRSGAAVRAQGLLARLFAGFRAAPTMVGVVRVAKANGVRTGLLSNSWGLDYPREGWAELFDAVVISGEVGMRKPEPRIFTYAADQLGLQPEQCVFVDDLAVNVRGAAAVGMVGVHHVSTEQTVAELEILLGLRFGDVAR